MHVGSQSVGKSYLSKSSSTRYVFWSGLLLLTLVTGCTSNYYRKSADRAAYGAIRAHSAAVRNMDPHFTLEQTNLLSLNDFPVGTNSPDYLGENGSREVGAHILKLKDTLDVAVHQSRDYQNHKEQLYLSALSLALERHQFAPIFSGKAARQSPARTCR